MIRITSELSTLPFLAGRLPVFEAVSLSPYFKINLPVFANNQFLNIKVYENDMRKNSLFSVTNFLGSLEIYTWDFQKCKKINPVIVYLTQKH